MIHFPVSLVMGIEVKDFVYDPLPLGKEGLDFWKESSVFYLKICLSLSPDSYRDRNDLNLRARVETKCQDPLVATGIFFAN